MERKEKLPNLNHKMIADCEICEFKNTILYDSTDLPKLYLALELATIVAEFHQEKTGHLVEVYTLKP